jgi:hypothetical protein
LQLAIDDLVDTYLVFRSFREKHNVLYKDIEEVEVVSTTAGSESVPVLTLYLHHHGVGKSPLKVNLKIFAARDQALLLNVIEESAPHARLNAQAESVRGGK